MAVALLSYVVPTLLEGNGYLSVYITGILLGNSQLENKKALVNFFDGATGLMQMLLFFLLGLLSLSPPSCPPSPPRPWPWSSSSLLWPGRRWSFC